MIEPQAAISATRQPLLHHHLPVAPDQRQQVMQRIFPIILLAGLHRIGRRRRIRNDRPFHPINPRRPATGQPIHRLLPRHIAIKFGPDRTAARVPLIGNEAERARARGIAHLLKRVRRRQPLGQHRHRPLAAPHGQRQKGKGPLQPKPKPPVIQHRKLIHRGPKHLAKTIPRRPTPDRRHAIRRPHRLIIMKSQARTQGEIPLPPLSRNLPALSHLRPHLAGQIHRGDIVIHHHAVIAGDHGRGPDRIQRGQIGLRYHPQRARRTALGESRRRHGSHHHRPTSHPLNLHLGGPASKKPGQRARPGRSAAPHPRRKFQNSANPGTRSRKLLRCAVTDI